MTTSNGDRRDQIIRLLDAMRERVEDARGQRFPLHPETWTQPHLHYNHDVNLPNVGPDVGLHVGWLEILQEAEHAQQLLDLAGISDGLAQGGGDVVERVAELVLREQDANARLAKIAEVHVRATGPIGDAKMFCVACGWRFPCPTRRWASGEADVDGPWHEEES